MKTSTIFYCFLALILAIGILALRPIKNLEARDCLSAEGTVNVLITEGRSGDIFFTLEGDSEVRYYINRGQEAGLIPEDIDGQYILLRYADHWTPLDPFGHNRHVAEVVLSNRIWYSELAHRR